MRASAVLNKAQWNLLSAMLVLYLGARFCQLGSDRLPVLLVVLLHVMPPAIFACIHASILYRVRGMLVFAGICLGVGTLSESIGVRTGIPFGDYVFTDVMGPRLLRIPISLVLAYLGMSYASWILALLILRYRDKPLTGFRVVALPLLASYLMLAWDLSMEADWATVDRAWIWRHGGPYFGVPLSNFVGWYLTAFVVYLAFALNLRARPSSALQYPTNFWRAAVLIYGICLAGNLLLIWAPMPLRAVDPSGKSWFTLDVVEVGAVMSMCVMAPMAVVAWLRARPQWAA